MQTAWNSYWWFISWRQETMLRYLKCLKPNYPKNQPRYLMGVGTPDYIVEIT